jgi:hypothetical protein
MGRLSGIDYLFDLDSGLPPRNTNLSQLRIESGVE